MIKQLVAFVVLASALAGVSAQSSPQGVDKFSVEDIPDFNPIVVPKPTPTQQAATPMAPVFIDPETIPTPEQPPAVTLGQSLPPQFIDPETIPTPEQPPAVTLGQSLPPQFIDPETIPTPKDIRERFRLHRNGKQHKRPSIHYGVHVGRPGRPDPMMGRRDPRHPKPSSGRFGVHHFKHAKKPTARVDHFSSSMLHQPGVDRNQMCGGLTKPLTDPATGKRLFCGRGGSRCPAGSACDVHPTDRFAVCCERQEIISLPQAMER